MPVEVPSPAGDPDRLAALPLAGFNVATLAGNHAYDQGPPGVRDTIGTLRTLGLQTAGTGTSIDEARQPALISRRDIRFGVLSYNAVGPRESWAGSQKPGAAYVHMLTHYEPEYGTPGGPGRVYTFLEPDSLEAMQRDVQALRPKVDVVVVAFHKGIGHMRAAIAHAEKHLCHEAVNAGADVVLGHHAHICKGIEIYRGKPIYHGLGNFVTPTRALSSDPSENASPERLAWARRRKQLFGFEPDPSMPNYAFHPESRNTLIARIVVSVDGIRRAGFIPCYIDDQVRPRPVCRGAGGEPILDYFAAITAEAGFNTHFTWNDVGDEVLIS
jgi:poly-gamma-glutamate synthesis protein (capsule biosynthesis protein)